MANVKKKAKAKAVILNLLVVVVAVILLLVSFTKNQQSDLKQFKIASGICTLLVEKKYEAAYVRMDDNFRLVNSLSGFTENVQKFLDGAEVIKKINNKNLAENDTYLSFDSELLTDKGTKKCSFIFSKNAALPLDLRFQRNRLNHKGY